jgi:hypothetical protein
MRYYTPSVDQSGEATEVPGPWAAECSNPHCPSHAGEPDDVTSGKRLRRV